MARVLSSTRFRLWSGVVVAVAMALVPMSQVGRVAAQQAGPTLSKNATVVAGGLLAPRGLAWGPDGNLYVAEAGAGGDRSTSKLTNTAAGPCLPSGPNWPSPALGGYTSRISVIDSKGNRSTFVDGLPSTALGTGPDTLLLGTESLQFVHGSLYALTDGGGCSHGNADVPNGILQIAPNGTWSIYNTSKFEAANPPRVKDTDYDPEGSWYSMTQLNGDLYAANANHQIIDKLSLSNGQVSRLIDMSVLPWIGPTAITTGTDGNFYVGTLGEFPIKAGSQRVYQVTPSGQSSTFATGLTAVTGLTFDKSNNLYAVELATQWGAQGPVPGSGMVVKVTASGPQPVATGLAFPTAITTGPDGNLYVSNFGAGPPGQGQIVKINPNASM